MSHNIMIQNGKPLYAEYREPAWHRLVEPFTDEIFTSSEMLERSGLAGRIVSLEPVFFDANMVGMDENKRAELDGIAPEPVAVPNTFASVSTWPNGERNVYGTVGARYGIVQDCDGFSVFDGFRAESMGALGDGRKVFATFALERETVLDPTGVADTVKVYGLAVNSHDGTSPLLWATTPVRVVCQNTLNAAMGRLSNVYKIRHTATAADRIHEHAEIYRRSLAYMDEFDKMAKSLFEKEFSTKQYENLFTTLFPKPEDDTKGRDTKWENKRADYMYAWNRPQNAGISGTAWGAWNALTEANQWGRSERDTDRGAEAFAAAGMGLDGPTNKFRADTLALVKSRAGVK